MAANRFSRLCRLQSSLIVAVYDVIGEQDAKSGATGAANRYRCCTITLVPTGTRA
jgi:hypothetical protein